jgi:putative flippase GtrA
LIRLAKYVGVGALATAIDVSLFSLFAGALHYNYFVVGCATFLLATVANYALGVRYVFESGVRFVRHHEIALVFVVSTVGLAMNQLVLYLGVEFLGINLIVSKLIATGVVVGWSYLARSHFVFKRPR